MVGQSIKDSKTINTAFTCRYVNLSISRTVDEVGRKPFSKIGRYVTLLCKVLVQLVQFRPNVCYISLSVGDSGFYKDVAVTVLAGLFGAKKVYHLHNKGVKPRSEKWYNDWLYRLVFYKAEVILLSEYLYTDIEKYVSRDRVHICPNGISNQLAVNSDQLAVGSRQSAVSSEQLAVSSEQSTINYQLPTTNYQLPSILFLSNLIVSKGVYILLDACRILKERQVKFHCTLVGGEGDITASELSSKIEEMGLADEVNYAGRQYGADKVKFLQQAELFVHPTYNDCFPLVLLEAMQYGLPIVSTTEGAIPGIVTDGENGFLVSPKDSTALAEKLETLILQPELREKMGAAGRMKYEQEYTLERFEKRITEIIEEVGSFTVSRKQF